MEFLRPGPCGPEVLPHQMVHSCAGGTEYPRWYTEEVHRSTPKNYTGNEDSSCSFARFLNLTSGLAIDSDKFKFIITLRRTQKIGHTGLYKNFDFYITYLCPSFFCNFSQNLLSHFLGTLGTNELIMNFHSHLNNTKYHSILHIT